MSNSNTSVEPSGGSVEIEIPSDNNIADTALQTYKRVVTKYAKAILEEASKVEYSNRGDAHTDAEYTSRYFLKAETTVLERGSRQRKTPKLIVGCHLLNPPLYLAAGAFWSLAPADGAWYAWAIATSLGAVLATALLVGHATSNGNSNG